MKRMKFLVVLVILIIARNWGFAQVTEEKEGVVRIEVIQNDDRLVKYPGMTSNVVIYFSNYALGGYDIAQPKDAVRQSFDVPMGGRFKVEFPTVSGKLYMRMFYGTPVGLNHSAAQGNIGGMDYVYVFEAGDDVQCTITEGAYTFTGKGADRLNCQSSIFREFAPDEVLKSESQTDLLEAGDYKTWLANNNKAHDAILSKRLAILEQYKSKLSRSFYQTLLANCYALRYYDPWRLNIITSRGNSEFYAAFKEDYFNNPPSIPDSVAAFPEDVLAASTMYANYLFQKINVELRLSNEKWLLTGADYSDYIKKFDEQFKTGVLKDKLYSILLFRSVPPHNDYSAYLIHASNAMSSSRYKKIFDDIKSLELKGAPIVADSFVDVEGKEVKLTDFKDKVMLVDFWYTGCPGCAANKKAMEPVVRMFRNNPDVGFISISIDEDKAKWMKSVRAGTYSGEHDINLYTKGLGSEHPFIEKYNINSYPTVFIIKNGQMVSSRPPDPRIPNGQQDLIDFITKAIKE